MNKKGFTLIELLAVIVILAIIALIATPIILNMINEARKSAAKSSTLGYVDSIEAYSGFRQLSEDTEIDGYDVDLPSMTNGKVTCTKTSSGWNSECSAFFNAVDKKNKGKAPDTATIIIGEDGKVQSGTKMKYNGYEVNYDGKDAYVGKNSSNSGSNSNTPQIVVQSPEDTLLCYDQNGVICGYSDSAYDKLVEICGENAINDSDSNCSYEVVIPDKIGDTNIVTIDYGYYSFSNGYYPGVKKYKISGSVKTIRSNAFSNVNLTSLILSEGLETIEEQAFSDNKLKTVVIPSTVKTIGENAFAGNDQLTTVKNKTNKAFNWCKIFNGYAKKNGEFVSDSNDSACSFVTGKIYANYGDDEVTITK